MMSDVFPLRCRVFLPQRSTKRIEEKILFVDGGLKSSALPPPLLFLKNFFCNPFRHKGVTILEQGLRK